MSMQRLCTNVLSSDEWANPSHDLRRLKPACATEFINALPGVKPATGEIKMTE